MIKTVIYKNFSVLLFIVLMAACSYPEQKQNYRPSYEPYTAEIVALLQKMTLDEKIGQLNLLTSDWSITGPTMRENYQDDIKNGDVGAIFNAYTAKYTRELQRLAVKETRLGIPLIFGYDVIHGHRTIFPIPLGMAASWDLKLIEEVARISAIEASAEGIHWTFSPMVDIARDPRWGRVAEGAGEDTYLTTRIGEAFVRGYQGEDLDNPTTILACPKHYVGYGAAQAGRDYNTVDISERVLRETYLPPFKAAIDAGAGSIMTSFNEVDGQPATGNTHILKDILRNEWHFNGFVVTDYTSINEMVLHGVAENDSDAGELAINSGVDMDMQGSVYQNYLKSLVESGKVSESRINEAVSNVLFLKFKLGLFDDPYRYCDTIREKNNIMTEDNLAKAREVAAKSMVLLKNENSLLPFSKSIKSIAVIGPLADNQRELIGSWSAAGDWTKSVSVLTGIKEAVSPNTKIHYALGVDFDTPNKSLLIEAIDLAKKSEVVILVLGEKALMSGEAASRANIDLPSRQKELVRSISELNKPTAIVLMNGRPLTLSEEYEQVDAMLEAWFPGTETGHAVADVLFGDINPSGKLTMSFPQVLGQIPLHYNHKNTGRPKSENKYTSKYIDAPNVPLFPFGYGLSYTTFAYSNLSLNKEELSEGDELKIKIKVSNTGERAGEEIVQLYIKDWVGSVTRPVKELKGFKKIYLMPGEQKTIEFTINSEDLSFYRKNMTWGSEPGKFTVYVGASSVENLSADFVIN